MSMGLYTNFKFKFTFGEVCQPLMFFKKGYIKNLYPFAYTPWSSGLTDNNEFACINSLMSQHEPFYHTNITFCK